MKRNQQLFGTSRRDYNERDMLRFTQSFIVLTYFPFSIKFSERVLRSLRVMIAAAVTARGWETTSPSELCSFFFFFYLFIFIFYKRTSVSPLNKSRWKIFHFLTSRARKQSFSSTDTGVSETAHVNKQSDTHAHTRSAVTRRATISR